MFSMLMRLFLLVCTIVTPHFVNSDRWALIITLAGTKKLNEYFEWSCRTIGASSDLLDMLVFHEGNERLKTMTCSNNVKLIDLGENGLAKLITSQILGGSDSTMSESNRKHLTMLLSNIIVHIPRYLVEIKPMTGILFQQYLTSYSHWSYTDPDIIWGNLSNWIDVQDTQGFDIVTLCKTLDAGRLFLRGQFALHRNIPKVNNLYLQLKYFQPESFAQRIAEASSLLTQGKPSEHIFYHCFHSAEGWYSIAAFTAGNSRNGSISSRGSSISQISTSKMNNLNSNNNSINMVLSNDNGKINNNIKYDDVSIKLISRGLDDFDLNPVILSNGVLRRCKRIQLSVCIFQMMMAMMVNSDTSSINSKSDSVMTNQLLPSSSSFSSTTLLSIPSIHNLPQIIPIKVDAYYDTEECNMQWLPQEVRYCIAKPFYTKDTSKKKNKKNSSQQPSIRITRIGEAFSYSSSTSSQSFLLSTNNFNANNNIQQPKVNTGSDNNSANNNRQWYANDEMVSRRQVNDYGAFFHFRNWDDFASVRMRTIWEKKDANEGSNIRCMVLQITSDQTMAFEPCEVVLHTLNVLSSNIDTNNAVDIHSVKESDSGSVDSNIFINNSKNNLNSKSNSNSTLKLSDITDTAIIKKDTTAIKKDTRLRKKKLKEAQGRREVVGNKNKDNSSDGDSDKKKKGYKKKRKSGSADSANSETATDNDKDGNNSNNSNSKNKGNALNAVQSELIMDSLQQKLKQARRKNEVGDRKKSQRFRTQS